MANDIVGFGDRFIYKGKAYYYMDEVKVKVRSKGKSEWVTNVLYYNSSGKYAREKKEFFQRFTKAPL